MTVGIWYVFFAVVIIRVRAYYVTMAISLHYCVNLVLGPSFCGSGSSNYKPSAHGIAAALHCIVAAILIGR